MRKSNLLTLLLFGFTALSWGQTFTVTTVAGAPPTNAVSVPSILLYAPEAVHIDAAGFMYIADSGGRRIYKIDPSTNSAVAAAVIKRKAALVIKRGQRFTASSYHIA